MIAQSCEDACPAPLSILLFRYSGVLMGVSNTAGTFPGMFMPSFTHAVAYSPNLHTLQRQWQTVFAVSAAVSVGGAAFYATFAQGEPIEFEEAAPQQLKAPLMARIGINSGDDGTLLQAELEGEHLPPQ